MVVAVDDAELRFLNIGGSWRDGLVYKHIVCFVDSCGYGSDSCDNGVGWLDHETWIRGVFYR